jgi:hypothetical protein
MEHMMHPREKVAPKHLAIAAACLVILALAGCQSAISTYDSTFTAARQISPSVRMQQALAPAPKLRVTPASRNNKPYFIEFRARNAHSYGHASVVFGKLDTNGNIPVDRNGVLIPGAVEISGLHPATTSTVPWSVGHIVPVPAETGPSDGDSEDAYVTARFRVDLTQAEFRKVVAIVRKHKAMHTVWYAPVISSNCLGYIGSIARDMGLKAPLVPKMPKDYVDSLRKLNS